MTDLQINEEELVATSCVSHLIQYPFEYFNPAQSVFMPHLYEDDKNIVITSPTGSGKSACIELTIARALETGRKGLYIAPMKSLAEEKLADWADPRHTFSQKKICVLTGDHEFTKDKMAQLEDADIILCTSEMLDSKTRNWEANTWLHDVGVLAADESHIVGAKKRGPCFETAIMRFCRLNPTCRIELVSATVPNDEDYRRWLNRLTGRETVMVRSNYRPCELRIHYEQFNSTAKQYWAQENARADKVMEIVRQSVRLGQSCLVFTGNKAWGRNFTRRLQGEGVTCEFHNADLPLERRREIETTFNNEGYEVLVASSTLAWGVNVNARNVVLAHTSYGKTEMDVADILQAAGRAGRVKYHTEGDCYIILPATSYHREKARVEGGFTVSSQLVELSTLMFHIVSEIHNGKVKNIADMNEWYEGSLAFAQGRAMNDGEWHKVINYLEKIRMIKLDEELGYYVTTPLGSIASVMYMSPVTMSDWYRNFGTIQSPLNVHDDGVFLCWALADTAENRAGFLSVADKESECIQRYASRVGRLTPVTKYAAIYWSMLNDHRIDDVLQSTAGQMRNDMDRVFNCLYMMHNRYAKFVPPTGNFPGWSRWDENVWMQLLRRMKYGVPANLINLVTVDGIGKTYATRLYTAGIRNKQDIVQNRELFLSILGKKGEKIYNELCGIKTA